MMIYTITSNGENNFESCALLPQEIEILHKYIDTKNGDVLGSITSYLLSKNPERYKDVELQIQRPKKYKGPFELERITSYDGSFFLVNERFKNFSEREKIPFHFYPCLLRGERRYIMTLDGLPEIHDLHMTADDDSYYSSKIFRSDILEYKGYEVFTKPSHVRLYVTEIMKKKLENEGFNVDFTEDTVKNMVFDKEKLDKEIPEIEKEWDRLIREVKLPERMKKETDIIDEYLETHPEVQT